MTHRRPLLALAIAPLAVALCTAIKLAVPAISPVDSFLLFFFAVAGSALVAGSAGGALATLLAAGVVTWFASRATGTLSATMVARLAAFVVEGGALTLLVHVLRSQRAQLRILRSNSETSRLLLTNIIETAPSAIVATEPDGTFFLFNRAAERLTGFTRDEVLGKPLLQLFVPPEWREQVVSRFREPVPEVLREPHRNPWFTKSGEQRLIEWRCAALPGDGGHRIIGVGVDVTDLQVIEEERNRLALAERTAREEAEDAVRAKDRFLAMISHELRGPLTAILGWAQMLVRMPDQEPSLRQGLMAIHDNAQAQARLVDDLLDFARIAAGGVQLDRRPVRVSEVVRSAVDAFVPEAQRKRLEIRMADPDGADVVVDGDERRLRQVFMNVLQNAIRYTDEGYIDVRAERENGRVRILIRDTGRGIAPEFLPQIFERFTQEGPRHPGRAGLGLGLAIVKELVTLHGGTVAAKSDGPGKGSAFSIELPVAS